MESVEHIRPMSMERKGTVVYLRVATRACESSQVVMRARDEKSHVAMDCMREVACDSPDYPPAVPDALGLAVKNCGEVDVAGPVESGVHEEAVGPDEDVRHSR